MKAKLRLTDRVFVCDDPACGYSQDRDLNAALNLACVAHRHAQAEGIKSYVARTGRFTPPARGGQVSLVGLDQHSPVKREDSSESSPVLPSTDELSCSERREALALAA